MSTIPDTAAFRIAVDLGAESGRVMLGRDGSDDLTELHRFSTAASAHSDGTLRWDLDAIWEGILTGLGRASGRTIASLGIDTWGVDYVLVDAANRPLAAPFCYRDQRTARGLARLDALLPRPERFARTGVQAASYNTAAQLAAEDPALLARASHLLFLGDHLHRRLLGDAAPARAEHSIAGSSELLVAGTTRFDAPLLRLLGLRPEQMPSVVRAGSDLGPLAPNLAARLKMSAATRIITPAVHDTSSAAACVRSGAYLSCGTWSLLGLVRTAPALDADVAAAGLTNEVAADGQTRLNRNIIGLWLVQECRRHYEAHGGGPTDYAELTAAATAARAAPTVLAVDDARFLGANAQAGAMPERIAAWYRERGMPTPQNAGETVRWILEGLAAAYAAAVRDLGRLSGAPVPAVTMLGGGVRNKLLVELARAALPCPLHVGPAEATALGNLRVQANG